MLKCDMLMIMKRELTSEGRIYSLPCVHSINGSEKTVCVVIHGFGSSKESPTAKMMLEELPKAGIGAIAFDLPAHGESEADGEFLRLENCVMDLESAETLARALAPNAKIVYFGSSFGAYITLLYLAKRRQDNSRAFLRAAAVSMPRIIDQNLTPEKRTILEKTGELIVNEDGYIRPLKLTQGFFDDLKCHDVFSLWQAGMAELMMVHGDTDDVVPFSDVQSFSEMFNVPLVVIPGGDHQLSTPGAPARVLNLAAEFFKSYTAINPASSY